MSTESNMADARLLGYVGSQPGSTRDSDSWYTPDDYLESARIVLGGIGFDPFTSEAANVRVQAKQFYTIDDDAFEQPWPVVGSVWMNPPYSRGVCAKSVETFIGEYQNGAFKRGIVLVNNATEAKWFQALLLHCTAVCLTDHRISFWNEDGKAKSGNTRGQAFFYFGEEPELFVKEFDQWGTTLLVTNYREHAPREKKQRRK